jgi:DNA-3-methyladenine glycosylase
MNRNPLGAGQPLREFLSGDARQLAPLLLGAVLTHDSRDGAVSVRLTEVEAYLGPEDSLHPDPGSHTYRGPTPRNAPMFGPAGHLYVYFTYGMHHCCNVVTGPEGRAGAVLLRGGEVVAGLDLARSRRPGVRDRDLARGPARLCRTLDLDRDHDGARLTGPPLILEPGEPVTPYETGPRVGLRGAPDRPWRFWIPGEPTVSSYRPAKPPRSRGDGGGTPI